MFNKKFSAHILISLSLFLTVFVTSVSGTVSAPSFPSCENPQGNLKVSYSSGTHGIPGKTELFEGSDSVYSQDSGNLVQCFCPTIGAGGLQTNWWRDPALTSNEIEDYKTRGWIFVADGLAWGLDPVAYLAKNSEYSCRAIGGGNPTVGDILGLAATGNVKVIYGLLFIGMFSILMSYLLKGKRI